MKTLYIKDELYSELILDGWRQITIPVDYYLSLEIHNTDLIKVANVNKKEPNTENSTEIEHCICRITSVMNVANKVVLGLQLNYVPVEN